MPQVRGFIRSQGFTEAECDLAQIKNLWTLSDAVKQLLLLVTHLVGGAGYQDGGVLGSNSLRSFGRRGFARLPPRGNEARHHGAPTSITFLADLSVET